MAGGIDVYSYAAGVTNTGAAGGGGSGSGKANFSELAVSVATDGAAIPLTVDVATGRHHKDASLVLCSNLSNSAATTTYRIDLDDVLLAASQESASAAGQDRSLSIDFAKVKWTLTRSDGTTVTGTFDVKGGKV